MGTIIYENKNSIVELTNAEERAREHIGIMTGIALILSSGLFLLIRSDFFTQMSVIDQIFAIGGLSMFIFFMIWSLKADKTVNELRLLFTIGIILIVPALII